jgi:hypothetical protein
MAGILAFVRFVMLRPSAAQADIVFDLHNPMLDAKPGECVEIEDSSNPGVVSCVTVQAPGPVLRPRLGPDRIGLYGELRHAAPYLPCTLTTPDPGQGCATGSGGKDNVLYPLGSFGVPSRVHMEPWSIRPVWKRWGGKERFTYEVQLLRHGLMQSSNAFWLTEEAPVTGTAFRTYSRAQGQPVNIVFRETDCPQR